MLLHLDPDLHVEASASGIIPGADPGIVPAGAGWVHPDEGSPLVAFDHRAVSALLRCLAAWKSRRDVPPLRRLIEFTRADAKATLEPAQVELHRCDLALVELHAVRADAAHVRSVPSRRMSPRREPEGFDLGSGHSETDRADALAGLQHQRRARRPRRCSGGCDHWRRSRGRRLALAVEVVGAVDLEHAAASKLRAMGSLRARFMPQPTRDVRADPVPSAA